jgi:hypothetical protein
MAPYGLSIVVRNKAACHLNAAVGTEMSFFHGDILVIGYTFSGPKDVIGSCEKDSEIRKSTRTAE